MRRSGCGDCRGGSCGAESDLLTDRILKLKLQLSPFHGRPEISSRPALLLSLTEQAEEVADPPNPLVILLLVLVLVGSVGGGLWFFMGRSQTTAYFLSDDGFVEVTFGMIDSRSL